MKYLRKLGEWQDLVGFEETHEIFCDGIITEIRSKSKQKEGRRFLSGLKTTYTMTSRTLKHTIRPDGYKNVRMCTYKYGKNTQVHRLIAIQFIPNPLNKPFVNHINGIKDDNRVENLEWCTIRENTIHSYENGLQLTGEANGMSKLKNFQVLEIREHLKNKTLRQCDIRRMYGVSPSIICKIYKGKSYKRIL